jgi:hypothetical protein
MGTESSERFKAGNAFWQGFLILNEIAGRGVEASLKKLLAFSRV